MARLTITLADDLHRALKQAAARRQTTIGEIIGESLEFYGVKTEAASEALVERARRRSGMSQRAALRLAVAETRAQRRK